jgi:hypothetical protein
LNPSNATVAQSRTGADIGAPQGGGRSAADVWSSGS